MARVTTQRRAKAVSEQFIGEIKHGDKEMKIYICRDDHFPDGEPFMFLRIKTPTHSMGWGLYIQQLIYLADSQPPLGG